MARLLPLDLLPRVAAVGLAVTLAAGCARVDPLGAPCDDLDVELVDRAAQAPANVGLRLRVTCDGRALASRLPATAFTLREDGQVLSPLESERVVRPVAREGEQLVAILLDLSGSVVRSGVRAEMLAGAKALIEGLGPEHRVALLGFDGRAELVPFTLFTSDRAALLRAIDRVAQSPIVDDSTNLYGAVVEALDTLDAAVEREQDAHGALVVFTDGTDRAGRKSEGDVSARLRFSDASVFAVGVGTELDPEALARIGRTGVLVAAAPNELTQTFREIADRVNAANQTDYLVGYCSPSRAGRRTLQVSVQNGKLEDTVSTTFDANGFGAGCSPDAIPLE